jgi:Epoxide hydrolase N terminus/Carbon-nitrogen hydrolase
MVADQSQSVQLAQLQELVRYGHGLRLAKAEAKLNAFPQFMTRIDGVGIHFIQVRSRHPNALPLIITHGWPGSVFEQVKLIGPLTDPAIEAGAVVSIGVNERDGGTLYNTQLLFDADGALIQRRRKGSPPGSARGRREAGGHGGARARAARG